MQWYSYREHMQSMKPVNMIMASSLKSMAPVNFVSHSKHPGMSVCVYEKLKERLSIAVSVPPTIC